MSIIPQSYGAIGDGLTDDTIAMQATLNAAVSGAGKIHLPIGKYLISATLTFTGPIVIEGEGAGIGPGVVNPLACSQILCASGFVSGDVLQGSGTYYGSVFRDFQIAGADGLGSTSPCPRTSGAGIRIIGPTTPANNTRTLISNVAFSGVNDCIYITRPAYPTIENCWFQTWTGAAYCEDEGGADWESAGGMFRNNVCMGDPSGSTPQLAGVLIEDGYIDILDNFIFGSQFGIRCVFGGIGNKGSIKIRGNTIEQVVVQQIYLSCSANGVWASMVSIQNNEFSGDMNPITNTACIFVDNPGFGFIAHLLIADNLMNTYMTNSGALIDVQSGSIVTIARNQLDNNSVSVSPTGIMVGGLVAAPCLVADNLLWGLTNLYAADYRSTIRDTTTGLTVAQLGSWANGSEIRVVDGHATSPTTGNWVVIGSGLGCTASRMQGSWLTIVG